jgi:hypothetical protein
MDVPSTVIGSWSIRLTNLNENSNGSTKFCKTPQHKHFENPLTISQVVTCIQMEQF